VILLDTHIWHWWTNQIPGKLSPATIMLIEESADVCVSAISCFEMAWLVRHSRIDSLWISMIGYNRLRKLELSDFFR
jgi:PIN domain nuclease of toxin-antitoxin system